MSAALSVVGDFYATALPLLLVRGLDLPRGQKTALYVLFGFGALVIAAGTVRTVLLNYLINETYDSTWWLWKMWLWTFVEVNVSIMAASAPALKPFFRRYLVDKVLSGGSRNRGKYAYGSGGQRISEALGGGGGGGQQGEGKKLWSNASSTVRDDGYDVEKIGTAVSSPDGTRKYELKALPSGRIHPVMVNAVEMGYGSGGEEVLPMTRRSSNAIHHEEEAARPAWVLPTLGAGEEGGRDGLRSFRAEIEALPSVPVGVGRKGSGSGSRKGSQRGGKMEERPGSKSGRVLVQGQQQQVVTRHANHETKPRSAGRAAARGPLGWDLSGDEGLDSHSHNHGHSNGGGSQRLERRASQGSVKVARMRAESLKREAAVAASARRAAERVREKGRSGSLEWDGEGWAHGGGGGGGNESGSGGGGSSSETLQLPRQGSVVFHEEGGRGSRQRDGESEEEERRRRRHDTASLHLPRQGARTGDFGGEDGEDYGDGDGDTGGEEEEWDRRSVGVAV